MSIIFFSICTWKSDTIMETQKGSSSFNMRLVRVSVDGEDEPVGRDATLRLRTQRNEAPLLTSNRQLMDIHIDGRMMVSFFSNLFRTCPFSLT